MKRDRARGTDREIVLDVRVGCSNEIVAYRRESLRPLWSYQVLFLSSSSPSFFPSQLDALPWVRKRLFSLSLGLYVQVSLFHQNIRETPSFLEKLPHSETQKLLLDCFKTPASQPRKFTKKAQPLEKLTLTSEAGSWSWTKPALVYRRRNYLPCSSLFLFSSISRSCG